MILIKICSICNKEKELEDYYFQIKISKKRGEWKYYRPECKECSSKRSLKWNKDNYDRYLLNKRNYDQTEKRKIPQYKFSTQRHQNGKYREWQRNNPEKNRQYNEQHRTHVMNEREWIQCKNYFANEDGEWCCAYCGFLHKNHTKKRLGKTYKQDLHKEHVVHDGANDLSNCIPSCQRCNSSKHKKDMEEWFTKQLFYSSKRLEKIQRWLSEDYTLHKERT